MKPEETIKERAEIYGEYRKGCTVRVKILNIIKDSYYYHHGNNMPELYLEYFHDIINKLSRLAVTPDHKDSWHDIAGYATRIEEFIEEGYNV